MRLALVLAALVSLVLVAEAGACSCVALSPESRYDQSDYAFIGTVTSTRGSVGDGYTTFRVDERFKGDFGDSVEIKTSYGTSCDISFQVGDQSGLLPHKEGGGYGAGSCSTMTPTEMRVAAGQAATMHTLVTGSFDGDVRTLALAQDGRIVATGAGSGDGLRIDVCPGSRYAVESLHVDNGHGLAIRALPSLEVVRELPIPTQGDGRVLVHCNDRDAKRPSVLASSHGTSTLWRLEGDRFKKLYSRRIGVSGATGFGYGAAYVQSGRRVVAIDTVSGRRGTLARAPRMEGELAGGPEGFVAGRAGTQAILVGPTGRVWKAPAGHHEGPIAWNTDLRHPRIAVTAGGENLLVFGGTLRRRGKFDSFGAAALCARGNRLWGLGEFGGLLTADLPAGPARHVTTLPGDPRDIAAVQ
jgi:hypothetical protein